MNACCQRSIVQFPFLTKQQPRVFNFLNYSFEREMKIYVMILSEEKGNRIDDHQPLTREDKKNQIAKRHWFTRQRSIYSRRAFASCCIYLANYLSRPFPYCSPRNITDEFDKNHACAVLCTNLISAHCPFLTFDHIDKQQRHQSTQQLPIRGTMFLAKLFLAREKKKDGQKNFSPLSHREAFSHFVGVASGRHRELQKCIREVEASNMAIINRNWSNRFQYENCSFRL